MIKITKIVITGSMDVNLNLNNIKEVEEYRKKLAAAYSVPDQEGRFDILFHLQSESYDEVKYPAKKHRT
jgi:hypothetical protein